MGFGVICGRNAYTAVPIAIIAIKIEKSDEKISSRMANILSWIAAALLGAASAVVLALLVWNGFLYLEYLRQPPLARPFSHGSFAPVGDDDDWTFKSQFVSLGHPQHPDLGADVGVCVRPVSAVRLGGMALQLPIDGPIVKIIQLPPFFRSPN